MKSVLNTEVSLFKDYRTSDNPKTINMLAFLESEKYAGIVEQIRAVENKKERDQLKAKLPACTPSGVFTYRAEKNLVRHSGLLQIDIDRGGNEELLREVDLREALADLPHVAYVGLSVSGKGYWGLVPLAYPNRHKEQFEALYLEFLSYGITPDTKPKNVASLRGYSYDNNAYFNHNAEPYTKCHKEPELPKADVPRTCVSPISDPIVVAVRTLEKQGIVYTTGNRHTYLWQFARLCNRFGVSREECKAYVDSVYGYNEKTNWLDSYKRYASEASIYIHPKQVATSEQQRTEPSVKYPTKVVGIGTKDSCLPYPYCILETTVLNGKSVTNELSSYGRYPKLWDN